MYRLTGKVPYLPVYCALFCPYLHKDKATKQATAFGLFGECCFISTFKLCSSFRFLFRFIPLLFIVGIRYVEATFAALIKGGCKFAVFCRCVSFVRFARSVIVLRAIQTTFAGVQLHIKTV